MDNSVKKDVKSTEYFKHLRSGWKQYGDVFHLNGIIYHPMKIDQMALSVARFSDET